MPCERVVLEAGGADTADMSNSPAVTEVKAITTGRINGERLVRESPALVEQREGVPFSESSGSG